MKRFIDCYLPTENCNLKCHYCYLSQWDDFKHNTVRIEKDPKFIRQALSCKRLGGICMINICAGGETLLFREVIDVVRELLEEGHYVMVVTNGTLTERFKEFVDFPKEFLSRLFFKFSFHFLEFKRLNLMDTFFNNVKLMNDIGASYTVEITPNDELIPYIEEIKQISYEKMGTLPHITIARKDKEDIPMLTKLSREEFIKTWSVFESELFDFKIKIFGEKRKEFCYSGDWSCIVNLVTGEVRQCYRGVTIQNIYKNIEEPFKPFAIGNCCNDPHCFNGHAWLTFGSIPELVTPTYFELRNRKPKNGREWVVGKMRDFMQTKLSDENEEYTSGKKKIINGKNHLINTVSNVKRSIKGIIKK